MPEPFHHPPPKHLRCRRCDGGGAVILHRKGRGGRDRYAAGDCPDCGGSGLAKSKGTVPPKFDEVV